MVNSIIMSSKLYSLCGACCLLIYFYLAKNSHVSVFNILIVLAGIEMMHLSFSKKTPSVKFFKIVLIALATLYIALIFLEGLGLASLMLVLFLMVHVVGVINE